MTNADAQSTVPSSSFAVRLVSPPCVDDAPRAWSPQTQRLASGQLRGSVVVRGTANSGVSSLLIDTASSLIQSGVDASQLSLVTPARETALYHRRELSRVLIQATDSFASGGESARSLHSLAFALIRGERQLRGDTADSDIWLTPGAEHHAIIREMLPFSASSGGYWPEQHVEAMGLPSFVQGLRDCILRAQERGITADQLEELGKRWNRPLWSATGSFMRDYQRTRALHGVQALNASELMSFAVALLEVDDAFADWASQRIRYLLVDDAQNLEPMAARLVEFLGRRAELFVLAGNTEHSVFSFRGANSEYFENAQADHVIELRSPQVMATERYVCASTPTLERDVVASSIRREHLLAGRPWQDMAVIVRSVGQIGPISRSLLTAGVPVHVDNSSLVLREQRVISAMLIAARSIYEQISADELTELLLGPLGSADPVTYRLLRRSLNVVRTAGRDKRSVDTLLMSMVGIGVTEAQRKRDWEEYGTPLENLGVLEMISDVAAILDAGRAASSEHETVERILWAMWSAANKAQKLQGMAFRGGTKGSQADRDLDAVMALFDVAGDYSERQPDGSLRSFISSIEAYDVPMNVRERRGVEPDAVTVLTAHSVTGMHFPFVVIAGVQDSVWPNTNETGSLFAQEELVALLDDGIDPGTPIQRLKDRVGEELRLFNLARTRGTEKVLITAVKNDDEDGEPEAPSRFLEDREPDEMVHTESAPRLLTVSSLVASLRRCLENPSSSREKKQAAARHLATLARAGVPGAHPSSWWGLAEPSGQNQRLEPVRLSPSKVDYLLTCPLSVALTKLDPFTANQDTILGTCVHAYAEAVANGADKDVAAEKVRVTYEALLDTPEWRREVEQERLKTALENAHRWLAEREGIELIGTELSLRVNLDPSRAHKMAPQVDGLAQDVTVQISGRVDRLELTSQGYEVTDYKTSSSPTTRNKTKDHAQLKAYQLGIYRGSVSRARGVTPRCDDNVEECAGAALVFLAAMTGGKPSDKAVVCSQAPMTKQELHDFEAQLCWVAWHLSVSHIPARPVDEKLCGNCAFQIMCPAYDKGKMIADAITYA